MNSYVSGSGVEDEALEPYEKLVFYSLLADLTERENVCNTLSGEEPSFLHKRTASGREKIIYGDEKETSAS